MMADRCECCREVMCRCQCELRVCEACGVEYKESAYAGLARVIMRQRPACGYECNKKLGQVR